MIAISDVVSTIISGGIDLISGALMEFAPLHYNVSLLPVEEKEQGSYKRKIKIDAFIIGNYDSLIRDIAVGKGEYLELLPDIVLLNASHKEQFKILLLNKREQLIRTTNGLDFVQKLNELMVKDPILYEDRMSL